jgi:sphingomyelin phosphodiesterase
MTSPVPAPITPYNTSAIEMDILNEIVAIVSGKTGFADNCTQCLAATEVMHITAISQPVETVTKLLIAMCKSFPA